MVKECKSLVGKLLVDHTIGVNLLKNIMGRIWKISKPASFKTVGRNVYIMTFEMEEEKY